MERKTRVLIVDDSALVRRMLTDLLGQHPQIEVVGAAQDGQFVPAKIESLRPDVVTLDVEMRHVGGLEILPDIIARYRLPVIMVSAHTQRGADSTLKALELGAVDFVAKPSAAGMAGMAEIAEELARKILAVRGKRIHKRPAAAARQAPAAHTPARRPLPAAPVLNGSVELIAIGASTGGTEAIKEVLTALPAGLPGIVIVQHMPEGFTKAFAQRLNSLCAIEVSEARDGEEIRPGTALVAPGSHHLSVRRRGARWFAELSLSPPVNRHRPSVDVLFHSAAEQAGPKCVGIILTGMGADGAKGMKALSDRGAHTIAQDEASCVVFGMPKEAIAMGGARAVKPLAHIPSALLHFLGGGPAPRQSSARPARAASI